MNFLSDFKKGFLCAFRGVNEFYHRPGYLIYMIVPALLLLVIYGLAIWGTWELYLWISSFLPDPQSWNEWVRWLAVVIRWVTGVAVFLASVILMGIGANSLFEGFGAILFDSMVSRFELEKYGHKAVKVNFAGECKLAWVAAWFAVVTLIIGSVAWIIGAFIPLAGWLLPSLMTCRRVGCSYLWSSILTHNSLSRRKEITAARGNIIAGFGIACIIMLAVPVLAIAFIPGMTLGGAILYNEYLEMSDRGRGL